MGFYALLMLTSYKKNKFFLNKCMGYKRRDFLKAGWEVFFKVLEYGHPRQKGLLFRWNYFECIFSRALLFHYTPKQQHYAQIWHLTLLGVCSGVEDRPFSWRNLITRARAHTHTLTHTHTHTHAHIRWMGGAWRRAACAHVWMWRIRAAAASFHGWCPAERRGDNLLICANKKRLKSELASNKEAAWVKCRVGWNSWNTSFSFSTYSSG